MGGGQQEDLAKLRSGQAAEAAAIPPRLASNGIVEFLRVAWKRGWFLGLLLVTATLIAYQPAWKGAPVYDDEDHLTPPELRSLTGLARIWTQLGVVSQYYPLYHSALWMEHRLWGNAMPGYHLVNILLHAFSALLLLRILRRLEVPGAWLAAAIFALHPVHVESVAWISEMKNTLSGVFISARRWHTWHLTATGGRSFMWRLCCCSCWVCCPKA